MSSELFDDYVTAPEGPQPRNPHDFKLKEDRDPESFFPRRGFFCVNCGQQMNQASPVCSQRPGTANVKPTAR